MPERIKSRRTRLLRAMVLAGALSALGIGQVLAAGPSRDPVPGGVIQLAAGEVCSFPVTLDVDSKEVALTFATTQIVTGRLTAVVTNGSTGQSISANVSGPAKYAFNDDGSLSISGGGPWLIWNTAGDPWGPGMWLTTGRVSMEFEADGTMSSLTVLGTRADVCALLG